ncbi:HAD-IA family hydrolase [Maribellus comscasis]|uniref:HAD-IA family hydrolase n=1 Tax=Maribellus comscasis TaxID=2681766 RepID=A0A6I6JWH8_9BACT|nr:HAD family phosphatase [Maribellus comscasis]QGY44492.1 HAD-IA family hydrolase [Maribellus comscasis]
MNPDLTNIKNIIFDLGNVLLNLDFDASIEAFRKIGLNDEVINRKHAYSDPIFYALEVGKVTTEEFSNQVRRVIKNPLATNKQIEDAWYAMIKEIPANRVKVVQELNKSFNVYLFSNTNEIHIRRLHKEFKDQHGIDFPSLFTKDFYSHEIQDRKPDLESFKKVIELSGVNPGETLFVDDLEPNILSAQKAGLQTLWLKKGMEMAEIFGETVTSES